MAEAVSYQVEQPSVAQPTVQPAPKSESDVPEFFIDLRPRFVNLPDISQKEKINIRYPLLPPYAFQSSRTSTTIPAGRETHLYQLPRNLYREYRQHYKCNSIKCFRVREYTHILRVSKFYTL